MFDQLRALSAERTLAATLERVGNSTRALRAVADSIAAIINLEGLALEYFTPTGGTERESRGTLADIDLDAIAYRSGAERNLNVPSHLIPFGDDRGGKGRMVFVSTNAVPIAAACSLERIAILLSECLRGLEGTERQNALSRDKELLIREMRHRYRNSLQCFLNLLPLVIPSTPDITPGIRELIEERIGALLTLQGLFEWTDGDGRVSVLSYFSQVTEMLRSMVTPGASVLRAEFAVDREMCMSRERAATIALILHELVVNSLKHAGPLQSGMRIRLEKCGNRLVLSFRDGGEGHASDKKPRYGATFGLGLGIIDGLIGRASGCREDTGISTHFFQAAFPL